MKPREDEIRADRRSGRSPYSSSPSVLTPPTHDTVEVRWFATGAVPDWAVEWFTESRAKASREIRRDAYLLCHSDDVGIKRRNHGPLEVKLRTERRGIIHLRNGLVGRVEQWRKLIATEPPTATAVGQWLDVHKTVLTRTYRLGEDDAVIEIEPDVSSPSGCDIELAEVAIGDSLAWTFAVEAWGPAPHRRTLFDRAAVEFFVSTGSPPALTDFLEVDMGYPEWLLTVHAGNRDGTTSPG